VEDMEGMTLLEFYRGKRVFVTGHTGFKGAWLCHILAGTGAQVVGYSLAPSTQPNLFSLAGIEEKVASILDDIRDSDALWKAFHSAEPEIVFHLAAQPIVRTSYEQPAYTYETNVMGTVNILECLRRSQCVRSFVNVTTDKVYQNNEWEWGYRENERLDGYDPYSNSKSCSELVTQCYQRSFFSGSDTAISTARAGNVIGGGDFAKDRIIPDCVRAVTQGRAIEVRNAYSTRPYQHVLEPLFAYLLIAQRQYENSGCAGTYNVGPNDCDCVTTGELVDLFCQKWGEQAAWLNRAEKGAPHEANFLKLDCSKIKKTFGWSPRWNVETAVEKTVEWTKCWYNGEDVRTCMDRQIGAFCACCTSGRRVCLTQKG